MSIYTYTYIYIHIHFTIVYKNTYISCIPIWYLWEGLTLSGFIPEIPKGLLWVLKKQGMYVQCPFLWVFAYIFVLKFSSYEKALYKEHFWVRFLYRLMSIINIHTHDVKWFGNFYWFTIFYTIFLILYFLIIITYLWIGCSDYPIDGMAVIL